MVYKPLIIGKFIVAFVIDYRYGDRQIKCAVRAPLRHAQEYRIVLSGGGESRARRGTGRVYPVLQQPGCHHESVVYRQ